MFTIRAPALACSVFGRFRCTDSGQGAWRRGARSVRRPRNLVTKRHLRFFFTPRTFGPAFAQDGSDGAGPCGPAVREEEMEVDKMVRWRMFAALAVAAVLFAVLAPGVNAQDEGAKAMKAELAKLREKLADAKKEGRWEDFIRLQRRIVELQEALEGGHEDPEGGGHGEMGEWIGRLKERIHGLPPEERVEALKRLVHELKERGEHDRAEAVHDLLKSILKPDKGDKGPEKDLKEIEKKIKKMSKEAERAERDFDFEKADALRRELHELEMHRERIVRGHEGEGRMSPEEMEQRVRELFMELMRARRAGDEDRVKALEREIAELRRAGVEGRGRPMERGDDRWRGEALGVLEETIGRVREWMEEAAREGDEEAVRGLEDAARGLKEFWEALERARGPEELGKIAAELEKAIGEIHGELREMREEGDSRKARWAQWAVERLERVRELMSGQQGERPEWIRHAQEILGEVGGRFERWIDRMREEGNRDAAKELSEGLEQVRMFIKHLDWADERILQEKLIPALEEGARQVQRNAEEARERGDFDKAEMAQWVCERMREAHEILTRGRGEGRPGPGREGMGRFGQRGPGGERPRMGREMRRLMEELHEAEMERDHGRMEELRRRIAELRERMGEGPQERPEPRPEEGERVQRETERLRKEIDGLRKELKDLKNLLKELLKEREKEKKRD